MSLFERLKRRKLFQWTIAYGAVAWGVVEVVDVIGGQFEWSLALQQSITVVLVFGFFIAVVVAWFHGERGHQRMPPVEVALILALVGGAVATLALRSSPEVAIEPAPSVAVLDFLEADPNKVVVPPFRVAGAVESLSYLREGLVDLLYARLAGEGGLRAVDPRSTLARLRVLLAGSENDPSIQEAMTLATDLGAAYVILGEVVGTPESVTLSASLLDVPSGSELGRESVTGQQSELIMLVDDLAARVLTTRAGASDYAIEASLPAVQAYLSGMQLERAGRGLEAIAAFDRALEADSTLTAAAFGLFRTGWVLGSSNTAQGRAARLLRSRRDQLGPRDARVLGTLIDDGPFVADYVQVIEDAIAAEPERLEFWHLLGRTLLNEGRYFGMDDWAERARLALDRASRLAPDYAPNLQDRMRLAFATEDTIGLREIWERYAELDSGSEYRDFYRWRVAVALDDRDALSDVRARFHEMPRTSVAWVVYQSILDGVPLDDAEAAVEAWLERAASDPALPQMGPVHGTLLLALGRIDAAVAMGFNVTRAVMLSDDYDAEKAVVQAQFESDVRQSADPVSPRLCQLSLIRGAEGDTIGLRAVIDEFESREEWMDPQGELGLCPALIGAVVEAQQPGGPSLALERADSIMRRGPGDATGSRGANYRLARVFEARGEFARALDASRRRQYFYNISVVIPLVASRREEGRLAALAGDTVGAIEAYEHYLTLRTDPDPELQPEVERVRRALEALTRGESER